jgi:AcrR family transcriptional regulator
MSSVHSAMPELAHSEGTGAGTFMRADALASRERILGAARALAGDRRVSMAEIAAAAGVGRSTLYGFASRQDLDRELQAQASAGGQSSPSGFGRVTTMPYRSPGQLGREQPLALEVTRILDEVPPHLVPDQLVAEARRAGGVAVALYVVDIDGSHLLRLAGAPEFPEHIDNPPRARPRDRARGTTRVLRDAPTATPRLRR